MDGSGLERRVEKSAPGRKSCPYCGHPQLQGWGTTRGGLQRLRCRGCRRTSSSATGRRHVTVRLPAAFEAVLDDMLGPHPSSCRVLARRLGVHHMTVWRWRIRLLACLQDARQGLRGAGGGVIVTRESRKASREWVNHERRPEVYPPPPRPRWRDLRRGEAPPGGWAAWHVVARLDPAGESSRENGLQARLERFLAPFRGPATRHLDGYAAWLGIRLSLQAG